MLMDEAKKLGGDLLQEAGDYHQRIIEVFDDSDGLGPLDLIVNLAHLDSRYSEEEKLTKLLEENASLAKSYGISIESTPISDITAPYLNSGFAVGYLVGREFRIEDMEIDDEAKEKAREILDVIKALTTKLGIQPWKDQGANA